MEKDLNLLNKIVLFYKKKTEIELVMFMCAKSAAVLSVVLPVAHRRMSRWWTKGRRGLG